MMFGRKGSKTVLLSSLLSVYIHSAAASPAVGKDALPSQVNIPSSQASVLACNFTGRPRVSITWKYPGAINGTYTSILHDSSGLTWTKGSLSITSVPKSCGTYSITCEGENSFGKANQSTVAKVKVGPGINNPSIDHTVIEGQRAILSCSAKGCPYPVITWEKTGSSSFSRNGETIIFPKIVPSDHGEYVYKVTAQGQTKTARGNLTVLYKPSSVILSSNASNVQQVPVNSTIMFSCSSDARPTARYIFYRNGKIEQNSPSNIWITPTLNCPSTSAGENFTCVAYNTVGNTSKTQSIMLFGNPPQLLQRVSEDVEYFKYTLSSRNRITCQAEICSDVQSTLFEKDSLQALKFLEKPKITQSPESSLTRNVTDSVVLTCAASGCPKPEITWKKVDSDPVLPKGGSYNIPKVSRLHEGSYVCFATAGGVAVNATAEIKVQYPPTLDRTLPQDETLCLHKSAILCCAALSGFPTPQLTLYNGSSILKMTSSSQLSHTITISSAADFKQYHCIASNLVGSDRVNITVNLAVKPTEPTDVVLKVEEMTTLYVTWKEPKCAGQHGISGYIIYYKITGKAVKTTPLENCCDYKIKELQEGTAYEVSIVAVDGQDKEGRKSDSKTTKTGVKEKSEPKPDNMGAIIGGAAGGGVWSLSLSL